MLVNILSFIGSVVGNVVSTACIFGMIDEPECPKSLIK